MVALVRTFSKPRARLGSPNGQTQPHRSELPPLPWVGHCTRAQFFRNRRRCHISANVCLLIAVGDLTMLAEPNNHELPAENERYEALVEARRPLTIGTVARVRPPIVLPSGQIVLTCRSGQDGHDEAGNPGQSVPVATASSVDFAFVLLF
jgi:hypothetical protein